MNHPAQNYLNAIPAPYEGGRNAALNQAAYQLRERFPDLSQMDHEILLSNWASAWPQPLAETEMVKTIRSAWSGAAAKGAVGSKQRMSYTPQAVHVKVATRPAAAEIAPGDYETAQSNWLPEPLADGTRRLLLAAFEEGDGVRISHAELNEEGREVPTEGLVLTREEWLRRLSDREGDPNRIWRLSDGAGLYLSINPMKAGGKGDSDVTRYKHALLEFDDISKPEQWHLINESRIPCAAVIDSGGKSIHAWVKVDAKDAQEYRERVKALYQHFSKYNPDEHNRNPSRYSRLPNCRRFDSRQELLAVNIGADDWLQWAADLTLAGEPKPFSIEELLDYAGQPDPNNVVGERYLCRGGSLLIQGQSGVGKSSFATQLAVQWAMGRPAFGIKVIKPLRVMVVQAENDKGDCADQVAGVIKGLGINVFENEFDDLNRNLIFVRNTTDTGAAFTDKLRRLVTKHRPDMVIVDPLLSFIGGDISKQEVCSQFLRNWLGPIMEESGVIMTFVHHAGKPSTDKDAKKGWSQNDWAYLGMGSSELVNWARAVMTLVQQQDVFRLILAKRGGRAGATSPDGSPTQTLWLRHSHEGICWVQVEEPVEEPKVAAPKRENLEIQFGPFLDSLDGEYKKSILVELVEEFAGNIVEGYSSRRARDKVNQWIRQGTVKETENGKLKKS